MAEPPFRVAIEDDTLTPWLIRIQERTEDLTEVMAAAVGVMDDAVQQAFETEGGGTWAELTDAYVERPVSRGGRGGDYHPILQSSGDLASPQPDFGRDFAELTFGEVYAAIHQFGGTPDMPPGPAAIPARPFADLPQEALEEIADLLRAYVEEA